MAWLEPFECSSLLEIARAHTLELMNAHIPIQVGNRQEIFCQQIVDGKTQSEAYRIAYNATENASRANSTRLIAKDIIKARIAQIRAANEASRRVTVPFLTKELLATAAEARADRNQAAANSCYMTVAKLHGLLVDRVQVDAVVRKPTLANAGPDEMSESSWLEEFGAVIDHQSSSSTDSTPSVIDNLPNRSEEEPK